MAISTPIFRKPHIPVCLSIGQSYVAIVIESAKKLKRSLAIAYVSVHLLFDPVVFGTLSCPSRVLQAEEVMVL